MDSVDGPGDSELIARVVAGDTTAFEALYDRYSGACYGLAYRILSEPTAAEDVVQDAFLTIWRQAATYGQTRGTVRSWLLTIVHHRAIDYLRRRREEYRQEDLDKLALVPDRVDTLEQVSQRIEGARVREALTHLPPDQQRSLLLAYFGGYTHDQIARLLGLPLGTVKGRLRMGLQKMRGYLHTAEVERP